MAHAGAQLQAGLGTAAPRTGWACWAGAWGLSRAGPKPPLPTPQTKKMAMGQNPNRLAPSEHPIQSNHYRLKWVVHLPQNGTICFDPQPNVGNLQGDLPRVRFVWVKRRSPLSNSYGAVTEVGVHKAEVSPFYLMYCIHHPFREAPMCCLVGFVVDRTGPMRISMLPILRFKRWCSRTLTSKGQSK